MNPIARGRNTAWLLKKHVAGLTLLAAALVACSSSTPTAAPARLETIHSPLEIRTAWLLHIGDGRGAYFRPAVLANAVYAASSSGNVVRVDPASGKEIWRTRLRGKLGAGVGSDGFLVAVAGQRGEIYVLTADGKLSWESRVPSDVIAAPLVGHGLVIVRSTDQSVSAFEAETGRRRWIYKRVTPPLTLRGASELAFSGENVLAGFPGGRLVAIALSNGAARWDSLVSEPKGATEVERLADVLGPLGMLGDEVCAASYQGRVGCFDASDGQEQWARDVVAGAGVTAEGKQVFAVDSTSTLFAFASSNGGDLWSSKALAYRSLSSPGTVAGWVVVGDYKGYVHWLDRNSGQLVGRARVDSGPIVTEPRPMMGGMLVQTQRGSLSLLMPRV